MSLSIKIPVLAIAALAASLALSSARAESPPRIEVAVADPGGSVTFIAYGDTRFTQREDVANAGARRALVARVAREMPAAILVGGDLVYEGSGPEDYETYKSETAAWSRAQIPVFPALGNHELRGCDKDMNPCLMHWWNAAVPIAVRSFRWYSVSLGPKILVLLLDSDSSLKAGSEQRTWFEQQMTHTGSAVEFVIVVLHYPPVRDPLFPSAKDEKEIAGYLSSHAHSLQARVVVIGSHVHNYERFSRDDVTYLVSGGGGAKPVPVLRLFGELSKLDTARNFHYIRFKLQGAELQGTMVRFDPDGNSETAWTEPDRFVVKAKPTGQPEGQSKGSPP